MKILKTVQKVPGGMMVIPLLLGVILNTVCPSLLQAGGYVTALWSSGGAQVDIPVGSWVSHLNIESLPRDYGSELSK